MKMLDNIVRLMQGTSSSSSSTIQEPSRLTSTRSSGKASEVYALMSKALLLLNDSEGDAQGLGIYLSHFYPRAYSNHL